MLGQVVVSLLLTGIFCTMFLIMMISPNTDSYKLRNSVFLYYLIAMTIIPVVVAIMGLFGVGFDFVTPLCREAAKQMEEQDPPQHLDGQKCRAFARGFFAVCLLVFTSIRLYFSYILKLYAD